ncbi:MAG: hypothetical protein MSH08_04295 [Ezakiella sp.]|nr:hypothetical protein [Ezakiella sp.]
MPENFHDYSEKERLASIETSIVNIEKQTEHLGMMQTAIDRLSLIQENQQKTLDKVVENLDEMRNLTEKVSSIGVVLTDHGDRLNAVESLASENKGKVDELESTQIRQDDYKREKMKSRYILIGTIITAVVGFITAIVSLIIGR